MGCDNDKDAKDNKELEEIERKEKQAIAKEKARKMKEKREKIDIQGNPAQNEQTATEDSPAGYLSKLRTKRKLRTPGDDYNQPESEVNNIEQSKDENSIMGNGFFQKLKGKAEKMNIGNEEEQNQVQEDRNGEIPKLRGKNIALKGLIIEKAEEEKEIYADFIDDCIEYHNRLRSSHNTPSLIENKYLTELAQKAAELLAANRRLEKSNAEYKGEKLGENQYVGNQIKGELMVRQWYNGYQKYDFTSPEKVPAESLSFTQLVWKNTKEVGFGYAKSNEQKFYGVALYYPAGNVKGEFEENVKDSF